MSETPQESAQTTLLEKGLQSSIQSTEPQIKMFASSREGLK